VLETLGIGGLQERLYLALVDTPQIDLDGLVLHSGSSEEQARTALAELVEHGMVKLQPGSTDRFVAVEPGIGLAGHLTQREQSAREASDQLERARTTVGQIIERYRVRGISHPLDLIEVVVGRQAVVERFYAIQKAARHEVRGIDTPPYIGTDSQTEQVMLESGVSYRCLYSTSALDIPAKLKNIAYAQTLGEEARLLADPPLKLVLVDDNRALIALSDARTGAGSALLVGPSALLDGLSRTFETLWRFAVRFTVQDSAESSGAPTIEESRLLAMLADGLTDRQIAERCRFSPRTAQTRVQNVMAKLNAKTRFQAGLEASRRGWL
jgi:DNA-binding CsgD family transcriptional regulator/sugar-specific transcriptional regulator TrmB